MSDGPAARVTLPPDAHMRKDVREFIRRLEAAGLTAESTPGHFRVLRDGKPLRKANGIPFMLVFSPDTIRRWVACPPGAPAAAGTWVRGSLERNLSLTASGH
jgi:hypothetical protein